jgi:hypothetical protein
MKALYIEWWDSSRSPGWQDAHTGGPMLCKSIGIEVCRDKKWITISTSYNGGTQYCDQLTIPLSCVKKIKRLDGIGGLSGN